MLLFRWPWAFIFSLFLHAGVVGVVLGLSSGNTTLESDGFEVLSFTPVKSAESKGMNKNLKNSLPRGRSEAHSQNTNLSGENENSGNRESNNLNPNPSSTSNSNSNSNSNSEGLINPADSGLITQGLKPLNLDEIKKIVKRTPEALEKNIVGHIKLKLLVDDQGKVRQVTPMNSLGYGLDDVAQAAAWKLLFSPAKIGSKNVATETYYTVRFNLEHN